MNKPQFLNTAQGRRIAYHLTEGRGPCVVFLGGYKSDMTGSKAVYLEDWAKAEGRAYLRLDYSGHGASDGVFEDGCIGDWAQDAEAAINALTQGPVILVGSSMGGWISLLMCLRLGRVAGLVTIAAAPDFTEDAFWAGFDETQRMQLMERGQVALPSDYGDPYIVTRRLIEDGRNHLVMRAPLALPFRVRFLQGSADKVVSSATALALLEHVESADATLTFLKGGDHSMSESDGLALIEHALRDVIAGFDG